MSKKNLIVTIAGLTLLFYSCTKTANINYSPAIVGKWRYSYSTLDSMISGNWAKPFTMYDSNVAENFADSIEFTPTDTVYYTYCGITTWSNYTTQGNNLILIGSGTNDTLTIESLNSNTLQLQVFTPSYNLKNWANFSKY